jgi:hypothetical protein
MTAPQDIYTIVFLRSESTTASANANATATDAAATAIAATTAAVATATAAATAAAAATATATTPATNWIALQLTNNGESATMIMKVPNGVKNTFIAHVL